MLFKSNVTPIILNNLPTIPDRNSNLFNFDLSIFGSYNPINSQATNSDVTYISLIYCEKIY